MSFKVKKLSPGDNFKTDDETAPLRGNVVIGRYGRPANYDDDRNTVQEVEVDEYIGIPGESRNRRISRNHMLVSENSSWSEEGWLDFYTGELPTGTKNYNAWDLNGTGTEVESIDSDTENPIYEIGGDVYIQIQPLNHFLGISGDEKNNRMGFENNIDSAAKNLSERGFETSRAKSPTWNEVRDELNNFKDATESDSLTYIMFTGHGDNRGSLCMNDGKVNPADFLSEVSDINGEKIVMIDGCYAGNFSNYGVPDNTSVYMAAGEQKQTQGGVTINGETRTRYAGRIVQELENESSEVSMHDIHDRVTSVSKVGANNPKRIGYGPDISRMK